jgi:hypothetical protein
LFRFLNLFGKRRALLEQDLQKELRCHLEHRVDELIERGLPMAEAARQAALEFGSMVRVEEEVRETWKMFRPETPTRKSPWWRTIGRGLTSAARRSP